MEKQRRICPLLESDLTGQKLRTPHLQALISKMVTRYQVRSSSKTLPAVGSGKALAELQMRLHALAVPETPLWSTKNTAPMLPYDVAGRVHHWTRSCVNAMRFRRHAEDRLFLDGQPSSANAQTTET